MEYSSVIGAVFRENTLDLSSREQALFVRLTEEMLRVNESMNLTAITDPRQIALKHYVDCAAIAQIPPVGASVADIGAGAGFPTLPLAILRPDLRITAVDSTEKRMRYVEDTAGLLGLESVEVLTARAEEMGKKTQYRESFDFVTARAVAPLNVLCELCLPLVRVGGLFCALKAAGGREELAQAESAAEVLGGTVREIREFSLTDASGIQSEEALRRVLILMEKTSPSPEKYPRRFARMQSDPL